jgi:pimeloyl-ACP methyl ester carboxylesterase
LIGRLELPAFTRKGWAALRMITAFQNRRYRIALVLTFAIVLITVAVAAFHGCAHVRAAALLLRMQNPQNPGALARLAVVSFEEYLTEVPTPSGQIRARLYVPKDRPNAPGMVIVHGVHHLGIDEPRLVAFARAMSSSGIRVLTPELLSLADYRVQQDSIDLIGYSARTLSALVGKKVGLLGISFGGGLAVMAAADPVFARYIGFVVSVGAHDDLERVSQFLITNRIQRPDGSILAMPAHEYGALVLIYSHVEDFFPPADVPTAHDALRLLLWERVEESRKRAEQLGPESRRKMELLFGHHEEMLASEIEGAIVRHQAEMSPVSPHGHLDSLQVPVLLLHGAADNVIPPSELLWLQGDVPPHALRGALISPAISHVDMKGEPSLADTFRLVHFMAQIFELTDSAAPVPSGVS